MRYVALIAWLLACVACGTSGSAELVTTQGRGVIAVDSEPPAGAKTFDRPTWRTGDRFVFRRGGRVRLAFRVAASNSDEIVLAEENTGVINRFDADIGMRSQELEGEQAMQRILAPADSQLSWPLWVGKRWTCHYVRNAPGQRPLPLVAAYEADALETVVVPAGTFETIRIWRRARPAIEGDYVEDWEVAWYAPDVGYFVKRLERGVMTVLEEYARQ